MKLLRSPMSARWTSGAIVLTLAGLAGCALPLSGTETAPPLIAPDSWSQESFALTDMRTDLSQWWRRFSDPILTDLIEQGLQFNPGIVVARAAVQQSSALRDVAVASLSPTLAWSVSAQRSAAGDRTAGSNLQAGANAAWDADLFGARQSAVDASVAGLLALEARLGEVQGALATSIALNYITLRGTQARLVIAQQNLDSQLETLQITRWRHQAGLIGAIEVEQAFVAGELTRSQLPPLETGREKALHALAVQVGKQPAALRDIVGSSTMVPSAVSGLGLGSPADALHQRADLRAARHLVEQAQANVALAQAQRYPALNFGASLGAGAASLEALSSVGAVVATAMMSLAGSLVDGGAANARIQAQQAVRAQAQANYQAVNLTVLQEAEDAIVALRSDQLRLLQLQQVAAAAGRAAALARQRFTSGLVDFQIVLDTQRSQLAAQDNLALANATVSSDQVRLYGALGGGWQPGLATIPAKTTPSP